MSREVRRVPANWQHPKTLRFNMNAGPTLMEERHIPLSPAKDLKRSIDELREAFTKIPTVREREERFAEIMEKYRPNGDYMPDFPRREATHYMMYETCSEGTPISPAFATPEELARWLTDTKASIFGDMTATYEQWLGIARGSDVACGALFDTGTGEFSPAIDKV